MGLIIYRYETPTSFTHYTCYLTIQLIYTKYVIYYLSLSYSYSFYNNESTELTLKLKDIRVFINIRNERAETNSGSFERVTGPKISNGNHNNYSNRLFK